MREDGRSGGEGGNDAFHACETFLGMVRDLPCGGRRLAHNVSSVWWRR